MPECDACLGDNTINFWGLTWVCCDCGYQFHVHRGLGYYPDER